MATTTNDSGSTLQKVSVLTLTVALGAMPVAAWVDRRSRVRAIALMGVVWNYAMSGLFVWRKR